MSQINCFPLKVLNVRAQYTANRNETRPGLCRLEMYHAYCHDCQLPAAAHFELRTMLNASPPPKPGSVLSTVSIFPGEETVPRELKCPGLNSHTTEIVILGTVRRPSESRSVFLDGKVNKKDSMYWEGGGTRCPYHRRCL